MPAVRKFRAAIIFSNMFLKGGGIMTLTKEIRKIVEYQNSILPRHDRRSEAIVSSIVADVIQANETNTVDFSKFETVTLRQDGKKRRIKMYPLFSNEEILCIYLKRVLDRRFHIEYPNRNTFMRSVFNMTAALKDIPDYTIFRFDFSDYFNSVSSAYVYAKYITEVSLERHEAALLKRFVDSTQYAYAGLNTSNIFCEIIAKRFDEKLLQKFNQQGLILYKRYIDDGMLIFNRFISEADCLAAINATIREVFFDPTVKVPSRCKTKLNMQKTKHIARRSLTPGSQETFDFLGYEFMLRPNGDEKTDFLYGITQKKIAKYTKRINSIVKKYASSGTKDIELLRHQIKGFSFRAVYRITHYKTVIWKSKGFISNYCELRYRMHKLIPATESFLKTVIFNAFTTNGVALPYFMKGNGNESIYNLYNNLKNYRTLLFVDLIGINMQTLEKMCQQIKIDTDNGKDYDGLVRDYLIKIKVGH